MKFARGNARLLIGRGRCKPDLEGTRSERLARTGRLLGLLSHPRFWLSVLLVTVAMTHIAAYPGLLNGHPTMLGPQENVRLELARQWVLEGRPSWELKAPPGLPGDAYHALTPRDASLQGDTVIPKDFPLAIGLVALLVAADPRLALATSTLSALALLWAVSSLTRRNGGPWSGVAAAALVSTTGAFTAASGGPVNTGATAATAVVIAVVLFMPATGLPGPPKAESSPGVRWGRDVLAGVVVGMAVGLRHDLVLLVLGLMVPFVLPLRTGWKRILRIGGAAAITFSPTFLYYEWMHGSPLTTGYDVGARALAVPGERFFSLLSLDRGMLLRHMDLYGGRFEVLALLAVAMLGFIRSRSPGARALGLGLFFGAVPYLTFVASRPLYGIDEFTLGASLLRYALPVFALLICLCLVELDPASRALQRVRTGVLTSVAVVGLALSVVSPGGLVDQRRQVQESSVLRAQVLKATEPEAIIVTARGDKFLWPRRTTLTAAYLIRDRAEGLRYGSTTYDVVPTPHRLAQVVSSLARAGSRVYLLSDSMPAYWGGLDVELRLAGVERKSTPVSSLFLIAVVSR